MIPRATAYNLGPTAGVQLVNRPGALHMVVLTADTVDAALDLYDNTAATGNPILSIKATIGRSEYPDLKGLNFNIGLFAVVTGTNAKLIAHYE